MAMYVPHSGHSFVDIRKLKLRSRPVRLSAAAFTKLLLDRQFVLCYLITSF